VPTRAGEERAKKTPGKKTKEHVYPKYDSPNTIELFSDLEWSLEMLVLKRVTITI
jgi:hypothetical protein